MDERDRRRLELVVEHARTALAYATAHGDAWRERGETVDAIITRITQIQEAARHLSPETQAGIPEVPWPAVRGMRDRIVHEYQHVDVELLAEAVEVDLPGLIEAVESALGG